MTYMKYYTIHFYIILSGTGAKIQSNRSFQEYEANFGIKKWTDQNFKAATEQVSTFYLFIWALFNVVCDG